jgi:hypothetical protein
MSEHTTIQNAVITSAELSLERGCLLGWVHVDYGNGGQGFGGYVLYVPSGYKHHQMDSGYAGHFVYRCLEVAGVEKWSDLQGKNIRVKGSSSRIEAIGHILKDVWFCPEEEFRVATKEGE